MKAYTKPSMTVERFLANVAVAACPSTTEYNPVTINCLATGSDTVFTAGTSGCEVALDAAGGAGVSYCIFVDNQGYAWFIWPKDGSGGFSNSDAVPSVIQSYSGGGFDKLRSVQQEAFQRGYLTSNGNTAYHIGALTSDTVSVINSSY